MQVTIGLRTLCVPTVDVARMVGSAAGFHIDLEPMEPGRVRVTASGLTEKMTFTGVDVQEACQKLIERLAGRL